MRRPTGLLPVVERGRKSPHQLLGNASSVWSPSWPHRLKRQLSLPDIFFEGHGCVGPQLVQPPPLCISPNRSDPSGHQTNQGTQTQSYFSGPALEEPALVLKAVSVAHCSPRAHSLGTGPPLSDKQNDVASQARAVGSAPFGILMGARRRPREISKHNHSG